MMDGLVKDLEAESAELLRLVEALPPSTNRECIYLALSQEDALSTGGV
jgi:hypothetical protein